MSENINNGNLHDEDSTGASFDFLEGAKTAGESGNALLSMYLYLAAFQKSLAASDIPSESAINGLKQAWSIACENKERSLAEYIFEIMEPYLTDSEVDECSMRLQELAIGKLEEFGISRKDIEEIAGSFADNIQSIGLGPDFEDFVNDILPSNISARILPDSTNKPAEEEAIVSLEPDSEPIDDEGDFFLLDDSELNYGNLAGFENTVQVMRNFGIGMEGDERFQQLIGMLNSRHGLRSMPTPDTLLIRCDAREDALRFVSATLGELSMPSMRMHMEENYQGLPILCVTASAIDFPQMKSLKNAFSDGGVLVLEDLDLWDPPEPFEMPEDGNPFLLMHMTRGAHEAMNLIQSAVANPKVFVIATAASESMIDSFFANVLGPTSIIDIDYPTAEERKSIWMDIAKNHPSFRSINKRDLIEYSANLPRADIYAAAREAVEEAYKIGLMTKKYRPITRENIFDKLAAYQPLDSSEYSKLEDQVIEDFKSDLDRLDDLLDSEDQG